MAEAEDVITDAARHATIWARKLWMRRAAGRPRAEDATDAPPDLRALAPRLGLLIHALQGQALPIRVAQAPARASLLRRAFDPLPWPAEALPATDGAAIWLPATLDGVDAAQVVTQYRALALQQAARCARGAARHAPGHADPALRAFHLLCEAAAADAAIVRVLPGMVAPLAALRRFARSRGHGIRAGAPHPASPAALAAGWLDDVPGPAASIGGIDLSDADARQALDAARLLAARWREADETVPPAGARAIRWRAASRGLLWPDRLFGALRRPVAGRAADRRAAGDDEVEDEGTPRAPRSARMDRRPDVREAEDDEDESREPGLWMIQTAEPHEHAEDPVGMQRPTDRDESVAAEEFADSLSELPEARLVSTPGRPKEVLVSEDAPPLPERVRTESVVQAGAALSYPEWDWRIGAYRTPGATVLASPGADGDPDWAPRVLTEQAGTLAEVRRRFEMLRARRLTQRRRVDGDDIDLDATVAAFAEWRAGLPLSDRLYQQQRAVRRDLAILLLIDASGSTDAWVAGGRRIIDVEKEALLLTGRALDALAEPWAVMAFSGDGPRAVTVRDIKGFDESNGPAVDRRIAALEPERYTRAGAAIRHATARLALRPARHRLLLLLSDGRPNDQDIYEGRYGVEDMRQAVVEARMQGLQPFCLTVDRQAADYLPRVFGPRRYGLLSDPARLPEVLLDWIRRLVAATG